MLLDVFLPLSLAFIMFSLGLGLTIADFTRVVRLPKAFAIGAKASLIEVSEIRSSSQIMHSPPCSRIASASGSALAAVRVVSTTK